MYYFSLFTINHIYADSPLTATNFYKAYLEEPIVTKALNTRGKIYEEILVYLTTDSNSLEIILAYAGIDDFEESDEVLSMYQVSEVSNNSIHERTDTD